MDHCLQQIIRFGLMLNGETPLDRDSSVAIAQLAFNAGRYAELAQINGKQMWGMIERCILINNYSDLVNFARSIIISQ